MKVKALLAGLALGIASTLPAAAAHEEIFVLSMSGLNESPVNASPGTGTAIITFDLDLFTMRVQAMFINLLAPTTAAHIHCCKTVAGISTAGVYTDIQSCSGFTLTGDM